MASIFRFIRKKDTIPETMDNLIKIAKVFQHRITRKSYNSDELLMLNHMVTAPSGAISRGPVPGSIVPSPVTSFSISKMAVGKISGKVNIFC